LFCDLSWDFIKIARQNSVLLTQLKEQSNIMQTYSLSSSYILTADIGGSHITVGICDLVSHQILEHSLCRVEVNSTDSAKDVLNSWGSTVEKVLNNHPALAIKGLGISMPGPFDYENGICYIKGLNKYEALYGLNIKQYFADFLNLDPPMVRFRNDAESIIAGEASTGSGKGFHRVLGITLGTGFGSAFCENKITRDLNLGSQLYKDTIADDHFSTRWFQKRYLQITGICLTDGVKELSGLAPESTVVGDIFKEFANNLSEFLSLPISQLQPEVLIICGNISKASKFFMPCLIDQKLNLTTIKLAQLDENAALIGAASTFDNNIETPSFNF
jgi:glucokinase